MWTLCRDIASASRERNGARETWAVDPLTRKVYVHSVTALLEPDEAARLQTAFLDPPSSKDVNLSAQGRTIQRLLGKMPADEAERALVELPAGFQQRLTAMSPAHYFADIHAPLLVVLHDRDDVVIPVSESRRLRNLLGGRAGVRYTEFTVFKHLDPTRGKPSPVALARELVRFLGAIHPLFFAAFSTSGPASSRIVTLPDAREMVVR